MGIEKADWNLDESKVEYGSLGRALDEISVSSAIFTVEPPWSSCAKLIRKLPLDIILVQETDEQLLENYVSRLKGIEFMIGLGGGRAIDCAKYVAWRNNARFISVPTILGADAYVTPSAAVRNDGIVSYLGRKFADKIIVDFSVIRSAPPRLNRAGVGDIYSAKISLLDWKYARDKEGEDYDETVVMKTENVLKKLMTSSKDIRDVTDAGIRSIVQMHLELNSLQFPFFQKGRTWPQEGTEHVFFYSLEKVTGRTFSHGEVLGMGAVVATCMHGQDVEEVIRDLDSFGLRFRPRDLDVSFSDFWQAIKNMKAITTAMHTHYGMLDQGGLSEGSTTELWMMLGS
jgi:glycerol-1-phosphate dehydrogenase [NAD(P)+]